MKVNIEKMKEQGLYEEPKKPRKKARAAPDLKRILPRPDIRSYPSWIKQGVAAVTVMSVFCFSITGFFFWYGPPGSRAPGRQDAVMTASVEPAAEMEEKLVQVTEMDMGSAGDTLEIMQMAMKNVPAADLPVTEESQTITEDGAEDDETQDTGEETDTPEDGNIYENGQESEDQIPGDEDTEDEKPGNDKSGDDVEDDKTSDEDADDEEPDEEPDEDADNSQDEEEEVLLAVAKVDGMLNVRAEASEDADVVGMLYKDSGGKILEHDGGWTQIESGDLTGWVQDDLLEMTTEEELLSSEKAVMEAKVTVTSLNVRTDCNTDAQIIGGVKNGDTVEVIAVQDDGWAEVVYNDSTGYINTNYAEVGLSLQTGDTMETYIEKVAEQKKAKIAKAEENAVEADLEVTVMEEYMPQDASDLEKLATIVYCEAGNQPYEGKVAVANVVLNRVASPKFPNDIDSVLRGDRQFQPVGSGKYDRMLNSGRIPQSCYDAAQEAMDGISYVGDCLYFKNPKIAGAHSGIPIEDHVFW